MPFERINNDTVNVWTDSGNASGAACSETARRLPEKLLRDIAVYIAENYVDVREMAVYSAVKGDCCPTPRRRSTKLQKAAPVAKSLSLEDMLKQEDAGFSETLLKLIEKSARKDSEVYKKANLSKQHFSKIRSNPGYRPTKQTAIALALALYEFDQALLGG